MVSKMSSMMRPGPRRADQVKKSVEGMGGAGIKKMLLQSATEAIVSRPRDAAHRAMRGINAYLPSVEQCCR